MNTPKKETYGPNPPGDTMEHDLEPLPAAWHIDIQDGLAKYVSDIIVATDLQDRIIYWNKAAEKFYGKHASELGLTEAAMIAGSVKAPAQYLLPSATIQGL